MTKVYLSGPISGLPIKKAQAMFAKAAVDVLDVVTDEVEVLNPLSLPLPSSSWSDCMLRDLLFLKDCDAIAMIPGWEQSHGAIIEHEFALALDIPVIDLS